MRGSLASSAILTGRRLSTEIPDTSGILIIAFSAAEPTSPVAPVRIRCIRKSMMLCDSQWVGWIWGQKEAGSKVLPPPLENKPARVNFVRSALPQYVPLST